MKTGFGGAIFTIIGSLFLQSVCAHPLTALEKRIDDNPYDSDFVLNLANVSATDNGLGAKIQGGAVDQFHALDGLRISNSMFTLDACGMNLPHIHPRATEEIYVMAGTNLTCGFSEENGGRTIMNTISQGWNAVFPMGLPHFQINNSCEEVRFLSSLSHEDPGVITLPDRILGFPDNVLQTAFNIGHYGNGTDQFKAKIDMREIQKKCLQTCKHSTPPHNSTAYNTTTTWH
ncbi:hypothetical protein NDN08_007093 [Rhodosorus marinus]|uniref:Cupin type-1 domain-containing protein n=1 Tax=Rhodosorus marinus TaxID=101924 RepID=A0AAV8UFL7_9RHOD|nr:hypothetical protein NDN08_007093 [Rhodosorus marinus]